MTGVKKQNVNLSAEAIVESLKTFFLEPSLANPLAALRIGVTTLLLFQALSIGSELFTLYGERGIIHVGLNDYLGNPYLPKFSWFAGALSQFDLSFNQMLVGFYVLYLAALVGLILGWHTRISAIAAWLIHFIFLNSNSDSNYGVDSFYHIMMFYFTWMPAGNAWSLDVLAGRASAEPSYQATVSLRLMQAHLCLVYFVAGWGKMQGHQWWSGEAIWRSVLLPEYHKFDFYWLAQVPVVTKLAAWGTLAIETAYPIFIWPKRTRIPWILLVAALHLGIALFQGLEMFGLTMLTLTVATFGISHRPKKAIDSRLNETRFEKVPV